MKAAAAEWFRPWILIRGLRDDKCHHPAHYVVCDLNPIDYAGRGLVLPQPWFVVVQSLSSVQFSHSVMSDSLWPHELQHARPPCPSPTPRVYSNSCPLSRWCHPTISLSVAPFSSCPQPFPASGSLTVDIQINQPVSHISTTQLGLPNVCFCDHGCLANEPGPELRFHPSYCWCVSVPDYAR